MKKLISIIALFSAILCSAQTMMHVDITSDYNAEKGQWVYYANNPNVYPVTMHIVFSRMSNVTSTVFNDAHIVLPGRQKSVCYRLTKNNKNEQADWERSYTLYVGNPNATHNNDVIYFLPVAPGKKVVARNLVSLSRKFKHDENGDSLIAFQFLYNEGDTVFACRKGQVCEVEEGINDEGDEDFSFKREVNNILVLQPDQTFAKYKIFKKDGIFVEPGETIYPGTPLGLAGGQNFSSGYQMRYFVYKTVKRTDENVKNKHYWDYYSPIFIYNEGETGQLQSRREYIGIHPLDIIVAEMSRREKKKWLKKNEQVNLEELKQKKR